jgi:putative transposase
VAIGRRQRELPFPSGWGGRREGAGRKPGPRPWVPRVPRPAHEAAHPVHVTLRARPEVGDLRLARVFPALREAVRAASTGRFRVCHFSVQRDHVHLIVEADSRRALSRGVQGLAIRLARAVNRARGRSGKVWADRYHDRALTTPREVRNALVYVLTNWKKHRAIARPIDWCSSGPWFEGWARWPGRPPEGVACPVAAPQTWLLRVGWRRHGPVRADERPAG